MNAQTTFRVAVVQMDPQLGELAVNINAVLAGIEEAAHGGAQLVVFPECALSGYVYNSAAEVGASAIGREHSAVGVIADRCATLQVHAIVGLLEADSDMGTLYNSAVLVGPSAPQWYRKCHLPVLGIDRYVGHGADLPVFDLPFGRIGILICYDVRFPEAARSLALRGIDLLVVPTNWPAGAESAPEFLTRARAWENRIYVAACNRVGVERGTRFIGRSQIVAPDGTFLAQADGASHTILYGDIDVRMARQKKVVFEPGVFELDPVGGRRPDLYGNLVNP
jgi:5-aminopentanamidase